MEAEHGGSWIEFRDAHGDWGRGVAVGVGAGDALFSAFVHSYLANGNPYLALRKAVIFAGYKIGETGAADGFLSSASLDALLQVG